MSGRGGRGAGDAGTGWSSSLLVVAAPGKVIGPPVAVVGDGSPPPSAPSVGVLSAGAVALVWVTNVVGYIGSTAPGDMVESSVGSVGEVLVAGVY